MTIKMLVAGILMNPLLKLQYATGGKCGGFGLYSTLWRIYTDNYQNRRSGYVLKDWKNARAQ